MCLTNCYSVKLEKNVKTIRANVACSSCGLCYQFLQNHPTMSYCLSFSPSACWCVSKATFFVYIVGEGIKKLQNYFFLFSSVTPSISQCKAFRTCYKLHICYSFKPQKKNRNIYVHAVFSMPVKQKSAPLCCNWRC